VIYFSWYSLLEIPFPNDDQRNTRESLSKTKRKVLLLQKDAATDHSLIGRTQWAGSQLRFYLSAPQPDGQVWVHSLPDCLAIVWGKSKVFLHSDILQFNERVITHEFQLSHSKRVISQGRLKTGDRGWHFYSWFQEYEAQKKKMIVVWLSYRKGRSSSLRLGHLVTNSSLFDHKNLAGSSNISQSM
jgi:hypothetical protein